MRLYTRREARMDRRKTVILGSVLIIALLVGVYAWSALTAEEEGTPIWNELEITDVNVGGLNGTVVVERTARNSILNISAGNSTEDGRFESALIVMVDDIAVVDGTSESERGPVAYIVISVIFYGMKFENAGDYRIKYLWLGVSKDHIPEKMSDGYASVYLYDASKIAGINASIIDSDTIVYSNEMGYAFFRCVPSVDNPEVAGMGMLWEWMFYDCTNSTEIQNHTLTVKATLTYGKKGIFGWYDEHTLTTGVVIKLVNRY